MTLYTLIEITIMLDYST